jgi:hypothetical protein
MELNIMKFNGNAINLQQNCKSKVNKYFTDLNYNLVVKEFMYQQSLSIETRRDTREIKLTLSCQSISLCRPCQQHS